MINRLYSARPKLQLASCCLASDIKLENAHSALGDARATAALFSFYLQKLDLNNLPWNDLCQQSLDCFWPKDLPKSTQPFPHAETLRKEPADAWLSQLVASIPSINVPKIDSYMAALETFLLDYELSKTEKSQLIILAENCGIRRSQVDEIHRKTFQLMVIRTMEDGIIDEYEKAKLADLGATFGIPKAEVERYMHDLKLIDAKDSLAISYSTQTLSLELGDQIVFTGAMKCERKEWENLVKEKGLSVGSVTKLTKLVVAADPDSMSGKAAKARSYGIPIVNEAPGNAFLLN